jgi:hypothetical protein
MRRLAGPPQESRRARRPLTLAANALLQARYCVPKEASTPSAASS